MVLGETSRILVALDTHARKNEPTLDHSGGGVHGIFHEYSMRSF